MNQKEIKNKKINEILRVNHAGEFGAQNIYKGQYFILKNRKIGSQVLEMMQQEEKHLEYFERKITQEKTSPTIMSPIWKIGGKALGVITACAGNNIAMLCTEAVEEVIVKHYDDQIQYLNENSSDETQELKENITQFRNEEEEHKHLAIQHYSQESLGYKLIKNIIQNITKSAILISKKI